MAWGALIAGPTSSRATSAKLFGSGPISRPINLSFARIAGNGNVQRPSRAIKISSMNDFKYSVETRGGDGGGTGGNGGDNDDWGDSSGGDDGSDFGGKLWLLLFAAVAAVGFFGLYQRNQDKATTGSEGGTSGDLDLDT